MDPKSHQSFILFVSKELQTMLCCQIVRLILMFLSMTRTISTIKFCNVTALFWFSFDTNNNQNLVRPRCPSLIESCYISCVLPYQPLPNVFFIKGPLLHMPFCLRSSLIQPKKGHKDLSCGTQRMSIATVSIDWFIFFTPRKKVPFWGAPDCRK